jgi:hypothetical protein
MKDNKVPKLVEDATVSDDTLPFSLLKLPQPPCSGSTPPAVVGGAAVTFCWESLPVITHITEFPMELQVYLLTFLRAYDLAAVHQTCRYYRSPALVHAIVLHAAEGGVYPAELTQGFEQQPVMADANDDNDNNDKKVSSSKKGGPKKKTPPVAPVATAIQQKKHYTFEHLRNMELLVVARVLSRPEPFSEDNHAGAGGYFVSKSWCKTALKWLEWQQERQQRHAQLQANAKKNHNNNNSSNKKLSKKQQRLQQRKYSEVASPPCPNVNSDIVCCHLQLQRCSNRKSARARRKILDKQAWKCLKKFYPESVSLETTTGECLQCLLEAETVKKTHQQWEEKRKEERKAPLSQPALRRFYTRTRGLPVHCLKEKTLDTSTSHSGAEEEDDDDDDSKMPATPLLKVGTRAVEDHAATRRPLVTCPLVPGLYYAVPRAWCHAWRKYMKTGEGGPLLPPDASTLLCDCHRLSLLPPHLEAYLYGESPQLWITKKQQQHHIEEDIMDDASSQFASPPVARHSSLVVGLSSEVAVSPFDNNVVLPSELGLSPTELALQQRAMITLERQREQQQQREREAAMIIMDDNNNNNGRRASLGEQLDRENYCCVEIMAHDELEALEKLWPRQSVFRLSFQVLDKGDVCFSTQPCRECDASGMANFCKIPKTSKANLRAAHQVKVRTYNHKTSNNSVNGGSKPGIQLEY